MAVLRFICYSHLLHLLFFFLSERFCIFFWLQNGLLAFFWKPQRVRKEKSTTSFPDNWFWLTVFVLFVSTLLYVPFQCWPVWMSTQLSLLRVCMSVSHAFWSTLWVQVVHLKTRGQEQALRVEIWVQYMKIPDMNFCTRFRFLPPGHLEALGKSRAGETISRVPCQLCAVQEWTLSQKTLCLSQPHMSEQLDLAWPWEHVSHLPWWGYECPCRVTLWTSGSWQCTSLCREEKTTAAWKLRSPSWDEMFSPPAVQMHGVPVSPGWLAWG